MDYGIWQIYHDLSILTMVYKPTYNWGAPPCIYLTGESAKCSYILANTSTHLPADQCEHFDSLAFGVRRDIFANMEGGIQFIIGFFTTSKVENIMR